MKTLYDIIESIKDIVSQDYANKKVYDRDIADLLGIIPVNLATMKKRNKIPYEELLNFCAKRSIAINWLLFNQSPESLVEPTNRFYMIRFFSEVSASAGGGAYNDNVEHEELMLNENFISSLGGESELKNIEAIRVSGDSMEPLFNNDDIVFINRAKTHIGRGGIFTIQTEHGLFIKRLQVRIDGRVDIISDNKDYPQYSAHIGDIDVIGRVVARFGEIN